MYTRNLAFFLFIIYFSSAHRRRFERFRGIYFFIFQFTHRKTRRRVCMGISLPIYYYIIIKIAYARARVLIFRRRRHRVSSPPKIGFCTNTHTHTYTRIIIYIHIICMCVWCVFLFYPHSVRTRWSIAGESLLYESLRGAISPRIGIIIL